MDDGGTLVCPHSREGGSGALADSWITKYRLSARVDCMLSLAASVLFPEAAAYDLDVMRRDKIFFLTSLTRPAITESLVC